MEPRNVAQIKMLLHARKNFPTRFKLPLSADETLDALRHSLTLEVHARGGNLYESAEVTRQLTEAAKFLTEGKRVGLMIMGTLGNGKTTLMRAIRSLVNVMEVEHWTGETIVMREVSAKEIVRMARDNYSEFIKLCHHPALAIDDMGEEPVEVVSFGNAFNPLIDLISIRYDEQLLTIVTTNTLNKDIRTIYGARIADRLNEMMQVIIFKNRSYRK